jgi:hypothetical protein
MLVGLAAIVMVQRQSIWAAAAFGIFSGCLALTKALAFPVFFIAAPLAGLLVWSAARQGKRALLLVAISAVAFGAVVGPWMLRQGKFGHSISNPARGMIVLYYRMLINEMPSATYRASFYVWSPPEVRTMLEHLFGFGPADLEKGGAGQSLNRESTSFRKANARAQRAGRPDLTYTYVSRVFAEWTRRSEEFAARGVRSASRVAAASMLKEAKQRILSKPAAHLAATLPLAWQGLWVENAPYWLAPFLTLSLPLFMLWAIMARRPDAFAFAMVPLGFYLAYLLATHMIPRYVTPVVPAMIVCLVVLVYVAATSLYRRPESKTAAG